jgi:hypothetical protein
MVQRGAARRELTEHDVSVRDDGQRADRPQARRADPSGDRHRGECAGERVRKRLFGERADADAGERDAELARRQQARDARRRPEDDAGLGVAGARHRLEARAARANDRELRCHEEAIQGKEPEDGEYASEHPGNVTIGVCYPPLPGPSLTENARRPRLIAMTDDYRIEKTRRSVEVVLANGRQLEGDVFVQPFARFRPGPEEPLDLLNADDPFLPLALTNSDLLLVQKSQIAVVRTALPTDDDSVDRGVVGMHVELGLIDGSTLNGSIFPEVRMGRPRLVDILNDTKQPFIALFGTDHLQIVNRAHIAHARPLS